MTKLLIYEDNPQLREGLTMLINGSDGFEVLAAFRNCNHVIEEVNAWKPDVILMDIDMPGINGIEGLKKIREINDEVKILMLTVFDDNRNVFQAISNGANGYILKKTPPEKILGYIREALEGGAPMTPAIARKVLSLFSQPYQHTKDMQSLTAREQDVLTLLVRGFSYKMISAELQVGIETVRSHIKNIYGKLHVNSKSEAVAKAMHNKLV